MINSTIHEILKTHLIPSENFIYGFANLSGLLHKKFDGYSLGRTQRSPTQEDVILIRGMNVERFDPYRAGIR